MLYLREDFKKAWQGHDVYQLLENMEGEEFRALEARRTYRFQFQGRGFFAKVHRGVGWKEIIGNLLRCRLPILGARNEWLAVNALHQLGIDTMTAVAFGEKGCNPAKQKSFLVTEELENMISLEEVCSLWQQSTPSIRLKRAIIKKLADISRTLHSNGINHRDYYLCHFLASSDNISQCTATGENLRLYLIDLHRAQIHSSLSERWRRKDLSGLYYSAMNYGFSRNDMFRFIRHYTNKPLRDEFFQHLSMWKKIKHKSEKLYQRMKRKSGHPNY